MKIRNAIKDNCSRRTILAFAALSFLFLLVAGAVFIVNSFDREAAISRENADRHAMDELFRGDEFDIDIVANGESLSSEQQNILEENLEEDAGEIIDEPEDGGSGISDSSESIDEAALPIIPSMLPVPKKNGSRELRIGFVTDPHVESSGTGASRVLGKKFQTRLGYFIERMNNVFGADFLVANGDIIEGTRRPSETGMQELSLVKKIFDRTSIPAYWVLGNHDLRSVTKRQWKDVLGIRYEYTAFDAKKYRVFILDSNFTSDDTPVAPGTSFTRGKVSKEQVEWLEKELKETEKKPIVFMHHPPLRDIEAKTDEGLLKNAGELRRIFSENRVFAVFSGHIEDLYYEKADGVRYFSIPGLVKHPTYQGSFAEISLKDDGIEVDVSYLKKDGTYRTIQME